MILVLIISSGNIPLGKEVRMFRTSTFHPEESKTVRKVVFNFKDSIPNDTLTAYFSNENFPIALSRNIHSAVCLDGLCRLVDFTLYWEVTGKYLGYSLSKNEELTKREHAPFMESDYAKLNQILSDSSSLLRLYTEDEIHPLKQTGQYTDGRTGATIPDLSSSIVSDAAYTSYTFWHITYGATRDSVIAYTKDNLLTNYLLMSLLLSNDPYNQVKAMQWISEKKLISKQYIESAWSILHSENFYASKQALIFLKSCGIDKDILNKELIQLFDSKDLRIQNLIVEYFRESKKIPVSVVKKMIDGLKNDNYYQVNLKLNLLDNRYQPNQDDQLKLCELLVNENINIANRIYFFLRNLHSRIPFVVNRLNEYRENYL